MVAKCVYLYQYKTENNFKKHLGIKLFIAIFVHDNPAKIELKQYEIAHREVHPCRLTSSKKMQ
jgi:hypothetical protein